MGLLGREVIGKPCVVKTARTHYVGTVVGYMFKSGNYEVRINQTVKGTMKPGRTITVKGTDVYPV